MRIGSALLATTAALVLAFTAGNAGAATRHHARHHPRPVTAVQQQNALPNTSQNGNNPAKTYKDSHNPNLREEATLSLSGNNPTKRYKATHDANARMEATLSAKGNNPVKKYPAGMH